MSRSSACTNLSTSKSKIRAHCCTCAMHHFVIPPLLHLIPQPFCAQSVSYFVALTPCHASPWRTLTIANQTAQTLLTNPPSSLRSMPAPCPVPHQFRL